MALADDTSTSRSSKNDGSEDPPWAVIFSVAASVIAILGFLGYSTIGDLLPDRSGSSTSASAEPSESETVEPEPSESDTEELDTAESETAELETSESTAEAVPTSDEYDPTLLDDVSTDETPFDADALLPESFTDSAGVEYSLVASGVHDCTSAAHMTSNVREVLSNHGCSTAVTGNYLPGKENLLVSVHIHRFPDSSTAQQVMNDLAGSGRYGIFCPLNGAGSEVCDGGGFRDAWKSQYRRADHRYLVLSTAVFTNLTSSGEADEWTDPAADAAVSEAGPHNHTGS